jgi:ABC-type proline/glycine betaine transport system substrate-binding protein
MTFAQVRRWVTGAAMAALLLLGASAPAQAEQLSFSDVTGQSEAVLTPCVRDGLASAGITSEQMLIELLASGPRTRALVANQLRAVEARCGAPAGDQ